MFNKPLNEMNIIVICGGNSAEREVSLRSGDAVAKALEFNGINVLKLDGVQQLLEFDLKMYDAVFNILHGESGENGKLAGLLSAMAMNFTGSGVNGAVLSWDKDIAKTLVEKAGLKTPKSQKISHIKQLKINDKGPWIVKPNQEGSSVGLYYAKNKDELKKYSQKALETVDSILVENFIEGTECTVPVVNGIVLPAIVIVPSVGLYDYQAKYESNKTQYYCPSGLNKEVEQALKNDAQIAFDTLHLKGWARVDFIIDEDGNRWFLEANTTPGMTQTSLVPKAAKTHGWDFNQLVLQILSTAYDGDKND